MISAVIVHSFVAAVGVAFGYWCRDFLEMWRRR